jgi:FixJ family two-component response regulator
MPLSVVDDDQSVRDSTRSLLRSVGYKVTTFDSGEHFLESGSLTDTACLILDMRMPGMDGLKLQRRVKASQARVPIIFVTAHDDRTSRRLAIAADASNFFPKPFAASDLLGALQTALTTKSDA